MSVCQLNIHSLRNIHQAKLALHPVINVFHGANGSGKTSLLEAIYLLSAGYSFKTRETLPLVRYGEQHLTVYGRTFLDETISLRKIISGPTQVKLNAHLCLNNSMLARFIPCQVFYSDIFQIIDAGPSVRRSLMDWGMFHVKHEYHELWCNYRQVLKQRNALLRQRPTRNNILPWDRQLVELANHLDQLRQAYFKEWQVAFYQYLSILSDIECTINYYRGWRESGKTLDEILEEQFSSDCQRQYTQSGAHQADIRFKTDNATAKQGLSRGQQKIILIALKLAQGHLLEKNCIYLFDDITAELDIHHVQRLVRCLNEVKGQKMITVLDAEPFLSMLDSTEVQVYHLNQGMIGAVDNPGKNY